MNKVQCRLDGLVSGIAPFCRRLDFFVEGDAAMMKDHKLVGCLLVRVEMVRQFRRVGLRCHAGRQNDSDGRC